MRQFWDEAEPGFKAFMSNTTQLAHDMGPAIGGALGSLLDILLDTLGSDQVLDGVASLFQDLIGALQTIERIIYPMREPLGLIIGSVGKLAGAALPALASIFGGILTAFVPIADRLANLAVAVMPLLQDGLILLAQGLGDALSDYRVFDALYNLLSAIIGLIPTVVALLPPVMDFVLAITNLLAEVLPSIGEGLALLVEGLANAMSNPELLTAVQELILAVVDALPSLVGAIPVMVDLLIMIVNLLPAVIPVLKFILENLNWILPLVFSLIATIKLAIGAMTLMGIASTVALALTSPIGWVIIGIGLIIAAIGLLIMNWDWVKEKAGAAFEAIGEGASWIADFLSQTWEEASAGIGSFFSGIGDLVSDSLDTLGGFAESARDTVLDGFSDAGTWLVDTGTMLVRGFAEGIRNGVGALDELTRGLVSAVFNDMTSGLQRLDRATGGAVGHLPGGTWFSNQLHSMGEVDFAADRRDRMAAGHTTNWNIHNPNVQDLSQEVSRAASRDAAHVSFGG